MDENYERILVAKERVLFKSPPKRSNPAFDEFEGTIVTVIQQLGTGEKANVLLEELKDHAHANFCYRFRLQPIVNHPNRTITIKRKEKKQ